MNVSSEYWYVEAKKRVGMKWVC